MQLQARPVIPSGRGSDGRPSTDSSAPQSDRSPAAKVLGRCRRLICATRARVSAWQSRTLGADSYLLLPFSSTTGTKTEPSIAVDLSARSVRQVLAYMPVLRDLHLASSQGTSYVWGRPDGWGGQLNLLTSPWAWNWD